MQVSVAHRPPNTAVLMLRGSLDIDTAPSLKANLSRLVERPAPRVVVELSGLDFCDSMGVGVLMVRVWIGKKMLAWRPARRSRKWRS